MCDEEATHDSQREKGNGQVTKKSQLTSNTSVKNSSFSFEILEYLKN